MFDVRLNGHTVVKDLDIFDRVGHSTAHDEIVSFSIRRGKLSVQGEVSTFNGKLTVEFVKVSFYFFILNYWRNFCTSLSQCQFADYTVTPVPALNDSVQLLAWFVDLSSKQGCEVERDAGTD